jgi:hypothetical protein
MKALVYQGPGKKAWQEVPPPRIRHLTDVIVRVDTTTICGTDLHILKGDVPAVTPGRILGTRGRRGEEIPETPTTSPIRRRPPPDGGRAAQSPSVSDAATFTRAFRRWTAQSPRRFAEGTMPGG